MHRHFPGPSVGGSRRKGVGLGSSSCLLPPKAGWQKHQQPAPYKVYRTRTLAERCHAPPLGDEKLSMRDIWAATRSKRPGKRSLCPFMELRLQPHTFQSTLTFDCHPHPRLSDAATLSGPENRFPIARLEICVHMLHFPARASFSQLLCETVISTFTLCRKWNQPTHGHIRGSKSPLHALLCFLRPLRRSLSHTHARRHTGTRTHTHADRHTHSHSPHGQVSEP